MDVVECEALFRDNRGRHKKMNTNKIKEETKEDLIAEVQHVHMENEYLKK
jgi:hypothetical protein